MKQHNMGAVISYSLTLDQARSFNPESHQGTITEVEGPGCYDCKMVLHEIDELLALGIKECQGIRSISLDEQRSKGHGAWAGMPRERRRKMERIEARHAARTEQSAAKPTPVATPEKFASEERAQRSFARALIIQECGVTKLPNGKTKTLNIHDAASKFRRANDHEMTREQRAELLILAGLSPGSLAG